MKPHAIIALLLLLWSLTGCKDSSSGDKSANAPQQPSDPPSQTPPKSDEASSAVIISAGSDFIVNEDQNFRLEGKSKVTRNNSHPIVRVLWTQSSGPPATLTTQPDQNLVSFEAPQIEGGPDDLRFQFEAEDSEGQLLTDTVTVTVRDVIANDLPQVSAGADFSVYGGESFMLKGTASDPDGIASVRWHPEQPSEKLSLEDTDSSQASVKAPQVSEPRRYNFTFKAIDIRGGTSRDTVTVTVNPSAHNTAPVIEKLSIDPGVAAGGDSVELEAQASDPDNDALQFRWSQDPQDPFPLAIKNSGSQSAQVVVPDLSDPATLHFSLTVTDGARQDKRSGELRIVPRQAPDPGPISCLFNLAQDGCPLQLVGDLVGDGGALRCQNPLSTECRLNVIARASPPIADCLAAPSLEGCTQILGQLADPLFVLRHLPRPESASECTPAFDEQSFEHYAGVLHGHTGYSDGAIGTRPVDAFERVRKEGNRFMGISDHSDNARLPLSLTGDCFSERFLECLLADPDNPEDSFRKWRATQDQAQAATTPDFAAFRGFEWTSDRFGHVNVFFSDNVINAKTGPGYLVSMGLFWQWFIFPDFLGGGSDGLAVFNHPGREDLFENIVSNIPGGRDPAYTFNNFDHVPSANMRVVGLEVFGKGSQYDSSGRGGSWLSHALDKGWYLGAVGAEDHHGTTWGAPSLAKTVMIARSNNKTDLKEAMLARRFYAVAQNFNDIRMQFRIDREPMGARLGRPEGMELPARFELTRGPEAFSGTVEIVTRDNRVVKTFNGAKQSFSVRVSPEEPYYFLRVKHPDTGRPVAFSSPIWVEANTAPKPVCRYPDNDG